MGNAITAAKNLDLVNAPRASDYRRRVDAAIEDLGVRGVTIAQYGKLVEEVSRLSGVHRTTLRRNNVYSTMILVHYLRQKGGIGALDELDAPPEVLLAKVRQLKIELRAAKRQIRELQSACAQRILAIPDQVTTEVADASLSHVEFTNLGKLILELVDRSFGTFEIDFKNGIFKDLSAAPGKQKFGGAPQSSKFMKWAKAHSAYLETVQQLTKLAARERRPR
jgi:hypothetical protein